MAAAPPGNVPLAEAPLFFLDYDGTLAPIVDDPAAALPHPGVPALLTALAERYPVWIVTGRHLRDVADFLPDHTLPAIGLHGAQEGTLGGEIASRLPDEHVTQLADLRAAVPEGVGLHVEDKESTFAVHYRNADDPQAARTMLEAWAAQVPDGLTAIWGKAVVEIRANGLDKGAAVLEIVAQYPGRTPVYLGDDVTDEDAFRALGEQGLGIKVGDGETVASYRLADPDAVVEYLRRYV